MSDDNPNMNPRPLMMDSYVSFGVVCRIPLSLANDILQILKDNEEQVKFAYHRLGNNKLRLIESGPERET